MCRHGQSLNATVQIKELDDFSMVNNIQKFSSHLVVVTMSEADLISLSIN